MEKHQRAIEVLTAKLLTDASCKQTITEIAPLYKEAVSVRPTAREVMEGLNALSNAQLKPMPALKRMSRASEKIVLAPDGTGSAANICDIVRDMFECETMADVAALVELIAASPAIEILRIKFRFTTLSGGSSDVMITTIASRALPMSAKCRLRTQRWSGSARRWAATRCTRSSATRASCSSS